MELAPLTKQDLPALAKLSRLAAPDLTWMDAGEWGAQAFGDPESDGSFLLKALEKKALVGAAVGVTRKGPEGKQGWIKFAAVSPKARRRGVATLLFGELERRFQKRECLGVRLGACPPPYVSGGVPLLDTAAHCFLLGRGYERTGTVIDMTADLRRFKPAWSRDDLAKAKAAGIRKAGLREAGPLREMVRQAFPYWAWEIESGLEDGTVFVAGPAGGVTAFACAGATHKAWFGPMGTLESERGRGLGRLLMWKCLEALKKQGVKTARIPWVGPVPFYARHAGAEMGPVYWTFAKRI